MNKMNKMNKMKKKVRFNNQVEVSIYSSEGHKLIYKNLIKKKRRHKKQDKEDKFVDDLTSFLGGLVFVGTIYALTDCLIK